MYHHGRIASLVVGGLIAIGVPVAFAQDWGRSQTPRSGACFYENANFGGQYFCAGIGDDSVEVPRDANDRISSIRVFGNTEVTVFRDASYRGASAVISSDERDLRSMDWNDRISSFRVGASGYGRGGGGWGGGGSGSNGNWGRPPVPQQGGVCFYKGRDFEGDYFCSRVGEARAQVPKGSNDKISSIRVFGNAQVVVYRDSEYRGDSQVFSSDLGDLRRTGWNDLISSYRVGPARGNGWGNGGNGGGGRGWNDGGNSSDGRRISYQEAQAIVRRSYLSVLGREPDAEGAQGFVSALMNENWTEQRVVAALRNSQEYRDKQRR